MKGGREMGAWQPILRRQGPLCLRRSGAASCSRFGYRPLVAVVLAVAKSASCLRAAASADLPSYVSNWIGFCCRARMATHGCILNAATALSIWATVGGSFSDVRRLRRSSINTRAERLE